MSPSIDTGRVHDALAGSPALDERPDVLFAIAAGLYVGLLVAPLSTAGVARAVGGLGLLYLFTLGTVAVATAVGALVVRRRHGLPERLGGTWHRWLPAVAAPLVAGGAGAGMLAFGEFSGADRLLCLVAAVGGFSGGGILGIMSRTRYTKAVVAGSEQSATWRAAWPDRRRRPLQVLGAAAIAVALLGFVVSFVWHVQWVQTLVQFLVPAGAVVATFGQARTYRATAAGLEQQLPIARIMSEWGRFEGYTVAADAVVVYRRAPWRLPVICDRQGIDDEKAVVAALDRHLPRLPAA